MIQDYLQLINDSGLYFDLNLCEFDLNSGAFTVILSIFYKAFNLCEFDLNSGVFTVILSIFYKALRHSIFVSLISTLVHLL